MISPAESKKAAKGVRTYAKNSKRIIAIDIDLMCAVRIWRAFTLQVQEKGSGCVVLIASENALESYEEESPYGDMIGPVRLFHPGKH